MTRRRFRPRPRPYRPTLAGIIATAIAILMSGCAGSPVVKPEDQGLNPRITAYSYIEEGKLVALSVDTAAATKREDSKVIPLPVAVANKALGHLTLTRESFTLVDEQGNRYPLASVAEARSTGGKMSGDYRISSDFFDASAGRFVGFTYQPATFFPTVTAEPVGLRRAVASERIELAQRMWTQDVLYFPHPKGAVTGRRFELWVTAPELAEPVFVKFRIG